MLAGQGRLRPPQGRREEHVGRHRRVVDLGRAVGGDRVEDVRQAAGDEALVVRRRAPAEHLVGHGRLEQPGHVVDGLDGALGVEDDVHVLVLDRRPVGPEEGPGGHVGVDLVGHADAELDALLGLDPATAVEQLLVGAGAVRQPDLLPQALAVVAGVGGPSVAEPEVLVGGGVERAAGAEPDLLAEALHRLVLEVGQVEHALLQRRRREDELDQVVALAGGDLGRGPGQQLGLVDVVDAHVDAHLRAPVLGEGVEPGVVAGHEVAPLEDLQVARQLGGGLDEGGRDVGDDRRRGAWWRCCSCRRRPAR